MHTFILKILTSDEKLFEGEVISANLPTKDGEITVLANHAPLITLLSIGEIKIKGDIEQKFLVQGGVVDVRQSGKNEDGEVRILEVVILADQKLDKENFDLKKFEESFKRGHDANRENNSDFDLETFESELERGNYFKKLKSK